jgi:hypothetical protein
MTQIFADECTWFSEGNLRESTKSAGAKIIAGDNFFVTTYDTASNQFF